MRIIVETQVPLKKHKCWFPVPRSLNNQPARELIKNLIEDLELGCELDDVRECELRPITTVSDIIRDGDRISIKKINCDGTEVLTRNQDRNKRRRRKKEYSRDGIAASTSNNSNNNNN